MRRPRPTNLELSSLVNLRRQMKLVSVRAFSVVYYGSDRYEPYTLWQMAGDQQGVFVDMVRLNCL